MIGRAGGILGLLSTAVAWSVVLAAVGVGALLLGGSHAGGATANTGSNAVPGLAGAGWNPNQRTRLPDLPLPTGTLGAGPSAPAPGEGNCRVEETLGLFNDTSTPGNVPAANRPTALRGGCDSGQGEGFLSASSDSQTVIPVRTTTIPGGGPVGPVARDSGDGSPYGGHAASGTLSIVL